MVLPCGAGAQQQAAELPDLSRVRSLQRLGPGRYTITSLRQRLAEEGHACFYAAEPDPNSESDSYDPTRECFNIDGEVATTNDTQDAIAVGRAPVAREDPRTPRNDGWIDPPAQDDKTAQLAQLRELNANRIQTPEARAVALEKCTSKSLGRRSQSHLSTASLEQARTSWRQPCCCVTCLNPRTPKRGAFETRCRIYFKWRQLSKPRAQPLDVEGQSRRNTSSQPETKGRCRSIKDHPLEEEKRRPSKSTSSIINGDTSLDMTSTSIVAVDMGMQRSAATAPTAADDTIATKTGWPQNHQALESSVEQCAARHCQTRFDPRPALPNTTAKPSQSCGWQTSGLHASWEVLEETIEPSSTNYRSFSSTPLADGSRNSLPTRSTDLV